jgi:hypothetical protein
LSDFAWESLPCFAAAIRVGSDSSAYVSMCCYQSQVSWCTHRLEPPHIGRGGAGAGFIRVAVEPASVDVAGAGHGQHGHLRNGDLSCQTLRVRPQPWIGQQRPLLLNGELPSGVGEKLHDFRDARAPRPMPFTSLRRGLRKGAGSNPARNWHDLQRRLSASSQGPDPRLNFSSCGVGPTNVSTRQTDVNSGLRGRRSFFPIQRIQKPEGEIK